MIGLILAAGAGRRLRPYTDDLPKALVSVDTETSILDIALRNLAAVEICDVAIVVGYAAVAVERRQRDLERRYGVTIRLVANDKAETWNNAYSLWLARDLLTAGALLLNGDTVHPASVEETLLSNRGPDILLAVDSHKQLAEEEMKVDLVASGGVSRINKALDPATAYGEYIGAAVIEPAGAAPLADALEATWRRDSNLFYEDGFQEFVDRGGFVGTVPIGDAVAWVEVDNHADLEKAREIACHY